MKVIIPEHTQVNKSFDMILEDLDFHLLIDYDDVDHVETDAVVQYLKTIIEANWERRDFIKHFEAELTKYWQKNQEELNYEYRDLEDYLESRLPKMS